MDYFVKLSSKDRQDIIQKAAFDSGFREDVIEKDFWVCWVLDKLFSLKDFEGKFVFKGGTCLSKAYDIIKRFSEDIDITIDKSVIEPYFHLFGTSKKQKEEIKRIRKSTECFINQELLPALKKSFESELSKKDDWSLEFKEENGDIIFEFPKIRNNNPPLFPPFVPSNNYTYIRPSIKLEIGARGDTFPVENKIIIPYLSKSLPENFIKSTQVKVLDAKRNFIEKLLILHSVYCRPDYDLKPHYSRHYYDVYELIKSGIGHQALTHLEILKAVVQNTSFYWAEKWMNYEDIKSFSDIKLVPEDENKIKKLKEDYLQMQDMFFGEYPSFEVILKELNRFEAEVRS